MKIHLKIIICIIMIGNAFSQGQFDEWGAHLTIGNNFLDGYMKSDYYQNQQMTNIKLLHYYMKEGWVGGMFDMKYINTFNSEDSVLSTIDYYSFAVIGYWVPILKGKASLFKVDAKVHPFGSRFIQNDDYIYEPGIEISFSYNTEYAGFELCYFRTILLENSNRIAEMESINGFFLNWYVGLSEPLFRQNPPKPVPIPTTKPIPNPKPTPVPVRKPKPISIPQPLPYANT